MCVSEFKNSFLTGKLQRAGLSRSLRICQRGTNSLTSGTFQIFNPGLRIRIRILKIRFRIRFFQKWPEYSKHLDPTKTERKIKINLNIQAGVISDFSCLQNPAPFFSMSDPVFLDGQIRTRIRFFLTVRSGPGSTTLQFYQVRSNILFYAVLCRN